MKRLGNFAYRLERIIFGKRGIVTEVRSPEIVDSQKQLVNYQKDYNGELPQLITFRNPLGELKTVYSRLRKVPTGIPNFEFRLLYEKYKVGDKFIE